MIITALEEERDAVLAALGKTTKFDKGPQDVHTYFGASIKSKRKDQSIYDVVVTCLLEMGPINAAAQAAIVTKRWSPRYVLLVGIACGVKGEASHGDVLIATQVADYTLGKQANSQREIRWNVSPCSSTLLDSAINLTGNWHRKASRMRPKAGVPEKRKGVVASGGDVIADDNVISTYSASWPKLVGIEMEAGGVATALRQTNEQPDFLMVKGVSDFGSDKHDENVLPWRAYASHIAAAFAYEIIKSGPFSKPPEGIATIGNSNNIAEAERRWIYLQDAELEGVEISLVLKASVGRKWFERLLENVRIGFSRKGQSYKLSTALALSPTPNTKQPSSREEKPVCAFWEVYEAEPSYWVQRISPEVREFNLVAGLEASIPVDFLNLESRRLRDLAQLDHVGISLPPDAFSAGVQDCRMRFLGEQFSFDVAMSDCLEVYHEMAATFNQVSDAGNSPPMNFGMGFSGIQILEIFRKQLFPQNNDSRQNLPAIRGMGGANGKHVSFYPGMPVGFSKSPEADEYTFSMSVKNTDALKPRVAELERLTAAGSVDAMEYAELSAHYYGQGRYLDAIKCLSGAIASGLGNAPIHGLIAECLLHLGRSIEAYDHYSIVDALEPDKSAAQVGMGAAKSEMGDELAAFRHFEKAVELEPSLARNQANFGLALARQKRIPEAKLAYERAVQLDPLEGSYHYYLGLMCQEEGEPERAKTCFERACNLTPSDADSRELLTDLLVEAGEHEEALIWVQQAIDIEPTTRRYQLLGQSLIALERFTDSEAAFRNALRLEPEHAPSLVNLAIVLTHIDKLEDAIELVSKAVRLDASEQKFKRLLAELKAELSNKNA